MHTGFEILPFSAQWLEAEALSGEGEQGERAVRMARAAGKPARAVAKGGRGAGKGNMSGGTLSAKKGKGMPVDRYPRRRPVGWPGPWGGVWPAGVAVYEPDWLAVADAAPGDEPDSGAANDGDNSDDRGDAGEW